MFMVLSSWHKSFLRVDPVHLLNIEQCQAAAVPTLRRSQPTGPMSPPKAAIVYIRHRHLLLLSPKADIHFTVTRRVEDSVDLIQYKNT